MRTLNAGPPPKSFARYRADRAEFSVFSSDPATRYALWEQQRAKCAYCEKRLRDPSELNHRTRIEHFHPQSSDTWGADCAHCSGAASNDEAPTTWSNLLLCCDGYEAAGETYTCDKSKANQDICAEFRNPKSWQAEKLVSVSRAGRAEPASGLPPGADVVIDVVLNLNAKHLVDARKAVISAWRKRIVAHRDRHKGWTPKRRAEMIDRLRTAADSDEYAAVLLSLADTLAPSK